MLRLITWFIFVCCTTIVFAQKTNVDKRYRWIRKDVGKLTQKIIDGAETDSQKVDHIHFWITRNIEYDIKRFVKWDTDKQDVSSVLKNRKTLCTGYANLFHSMCGAAGVNSVVIHGYTKNTFVDIGDTSYLPDHSWNKVWVNGDWLNVDATWDASYVQFYKTSNFRQFLSRISFGIIRPVIYKPHSVSKPTTKFFLTNDRLFSVQHLPENYNAQGFITSVSNRSFDLDSAAYLYKDTVLFTNSTKVNTYLGWYSALSETAKIKEDGKHAATLNPKNQFGNVRYHMVDMRREVEKLQDDPKLYRKDSVFLKNMIQIADSVLFYNHKNDSLIWEEYRDLYKKYRDKLSQQRRYNTLYANYLKHVKARSKSRNGKLKHKIRRANYRKDRIKQKYNSLFKDHVTKPPKWSKKSNNEKLDSLVDVFRLYEDSITAHSGDMANLYQEIINSGDLLQQATTDQNQYTDSILGHFSSLISYRFFFSQDDYDYSIREVKRSLTTPQKKDSLLKLKQRYDEVDDLIDSLYRQGKQQFRYLKRQRSVLYKIKKITGNRTVYYSLDDDFRKNIRRAKKTESSYLDSAVAMLEFCKLLNRTNGSVQAPRTAVAFERRLWVPITISRNKRKKHLADNRALYRFAKRARTRCTADLSRLRN